MSQSSKAKENDMAGSKGGSASAAGVKGVFSHMKYEHLIAGVSGGVTSSVVLHPLDLIKVRFAVNDGRTSMPQYNSIRNALVTIYKQEGIRGLYRGVVPNVWGSGTAWGLYFLFYNTTKTWVQGGDPNMQLSWPMHMGAAAEAGILTLFLTNPLWVVKTRLCTQYGNEKPLYSGMIDCFNKIYKAEGIPGMYKGLVPGMIGVSHGAIQFMVYEEMKNWYNNYRGTVLSTRMSTSEYLFFAAASKLVAASITYPYQVVRARLQDHHHNYAGTMDCVSKTWRFEGPRGFYKGLGASLSRVVPATMITFVVYENVSRYILDHPFRNRNMNKL
ncbi:mitochondrial folate transporter/carrier [Frankliniella occidentalis]|uniref:Solute carrier family 25 member 32 n=1 Tax=Frankliniella occidentalis TaxID=133901 RepID=A0A6J1S8Q3_FRAOC|nr:mitochondrial folate transporter/carrier [Frankliniella occidentalis]